MSNNKKSNQTPVMIATRKTCGHPVTPQTSFFLPHETKPDVLREFCLICMMQKVIEQFKIQPCGELDLKSEKFLWRD